MCLNWLSGALVGVGGSDFIGYGYDRAWSCAAAADSPLAGGATCLTLLVSHYLSNTTCLRLLV